MTDSEQPSTPFSIVTTSAGAVSILAHDVGEIMHNPVGPWPEANALYIEASNLERRLAGTPDSPAFVLYDVGLGAGTNAVAALHVARRLGAGRRPLRIVSFERDLRLLQFTLENAVAFSFLDGYEPALRSLLDRGGWREEGVTWELHTGEFPELIQERETPPAHLIFFDPYSPKKNPEMWSRANFAKLRARCHPEEGALLLTYSRATPVRAALLDAGFYVGAGQGTGAKDETTQAATHPHLLSKILGPDFLGRFERSQSRWPSDLREDEQAKFAERLRAHPQFKP